MRIDVGGYALHAAHEGEGPPDYLCLHGLVDTLEVFDAVAPGLGGRVARFDQRGHGGSDAPPGPYAREDLASDAVAVLDALGLSRAILVGHSMGGVVALAAALAYPERVSGLVLLGTTSRCNEKAAAWYERIARAGEAHGLSGIRGAIYGEKSRREIRGDARGIAHVTRMLGSLCDDPLTPRLAEVACPALLLVGEKDPMGPRASEIIAGALPRASLEVVPGGGHWLHVDVPDVVTDAVSRWRRTS